MLFLGCKLVLYLIYYCINSCWFFLDVKQKIRPTSMVKGSDEVNEGLFCICLSGVACCIKAHTPLLANEFYILNISEYDIRIYDNHTLQTDSQHCEE